MAVRLSRRRRRLWRGRLGARRLLEATEMWSRRHCASLCRVGIERSGHPQQKAPDASSGATAKLPITGTVVLDVEQGGIEVPSFVGKTVRGAVEAAQDIGLQLDAVGSGVARQQTPVAGTHVAAGARVTVQFGQLSSKSSTTEDTEDTEDFA